MDVGVSVKGKEKVGWKVEVWGWDEEGVGVGGVREEVVV